MQHSRITIIHFQAQKKFLQNLREANSTQKLTLVMFTSKYPLKNKAQNYYV